MCLGVANCPYSKDDEDFIATKSTHDSARQVQIPPDIAAILKRINFNPNSAKRIDVGIGWDKTEKKVSIAMRRDFGNTERLSIKGKIRRSKKLIFSYGNLIKIS